MSDDHFEDDTLEVDLNVDMDDDGAGVAVDAGAYPSPVKRILAFVIDMLLMVALVIALGIVSFGTAILGSLMGGDMSSAMSSAGSSASVWIFAIGMAVLSLLPIVLPATKLRGSLGKHLMGIGITDMDHQRIGIARSFLRAFIWVLTAGWIIPAVILFFTKKRRAVHDFVAGTVVVTKNEVPNIGKTRGIGSKVLNGVVGLALLAMVGGPLAAMMMGAQAPGAMSGGDTPSLASMSSAGKSSFGKKKSGLSKEAKARMAKLKAKKNKGKKAGKRSKSDGKKSARKKKIDPSLLAGVDQLSELFEDKAVAKQQFPSSIDDLGLTKKRLGSYGVQDVSFSSNSEMTFSVETMDDSYTVKMRPYLDDEGYIGWKCSGNVRRKDLPNVCN